jgi:hypothetical protein
MTDNQRIWQNLSTLFLFPPLGPHNRNAAARAKIVDALLEVAATEMDDHDKIADIASLVHIKHEAEPRIAFYDNND